MSYIVSGLAFVYTYTLFHATDLYGMCGALSTRDVMTLPRVSRL